MGAWPPTAWAILLTEAGERFAFYGCVAILTLFLEQQVGLPPNQAAANFNYFVALCYFTPCLGSLFADGGLGKFRTIFYGSIIYLVGQFSLATSATQAAAAPSPQLLLVRLGLLLIALGAGAIKSCVGVYGAEQVKRSLDRVTASEEEAVIAKYFSIFYVFINIGSIAGEILVPGTKQRFGWAAAFSVPPVFLAIALTIFVAGSLHKNGYHTPESKGPSLQEYTTVVITATLHGWNSATLTHGTDQVENACQLLRIVAFMAPLPIFWMAWSQTGSTWVQQADKTSLEIVGGWTIDAGQWSVWNPIVVVIAAPLFAGVLYPFLGRYGRVTPSRKMVAGMVVGSLSFFAASVVENAIVSYQPDKISVFWTLPQWVLLSISEVLVSIPGLEFAFAEAPSDARSVVQAIWLLTSGIGSLLAGLALDYISLPYETLFGWTGVLLLVFALFFSRGVRRYNDRTEVALAYEDQRVGSGVHEPLMGGT